MKYAAPKSSMNDHIYSSIFLPKRRIDTVPLVPLVADPPANNHEISSSLVDLLTTFIHSQECAVAFEDDASFLESLRGASTIVYDNSFLGKSRESSAAVKKDVEIHWYPPYKCAVVARKVHGCTAVPVRNLTIVGLEKWTMDVQHNTHNRAAKTSRSEGFACAPITPLPEHLYQHFCDAVQQEFTELYQQDSKDGSTNHAEFPAFIELVSKNACEKLLRGEYKKDASDDSPKVSMVDGGWSDVISHTGGEWPLVQAVVRHLLSYSPLPKFTSSLWNKLICHFEYHLLANEVEELVLVIKNSSSSDKAALKCVNKFMTMMQSIARKAAALTQLYKMEMFETGLADLRQQLDDAMEYRTSTISYDYHLPEEIRKVGIDPKIDLPPLAAPVTRENKSLDDTKEMARQNIELYPLLSSSGYKGTLVNLLGRHPSNDNNLTVIHLAIKTIENYLFPLAGKLNGEYACDEKNLQIWADGYRTWSRRLLDFLAKNEKGERKSILKVELISRETLVMWLVFCLIHNSMKEKEELLKEYGVALEWRNVKHFVFSDKFAQDTSLHVSSYLQRNTNNKPLFSLSFQQFTLEFGERYGSKSEHFQSLWEEEKAAALERRDTHWKQVKEKQEKVAELQEQIASHLSSKEELEEKLAEIPFDHVERRKIEKDIKELLSTISVKRYSIQEEKRPPHRVLQPLPEQKENAMRMLFFLHMPEDMQRLIRMCIASQQMLVPSTQWTKHTALGKEKSDKIRKSIKSEATHSLEDLSSYYNSHRPTKRSECKVLHLYSTSKAPRPTWIGPNDVMEYTNPSQGIYHPDHLRPLLFWNGGGCTTDKWDTFFNPFAHTNAVAKVEYFTEKTEDEKIQYTFSQYGRETELDRGNRPIAKQRFKPKWLQKPQWLAFASLRAFPFQQLRRLCAIIRDRKLPFDNPTVHNIIRMTLFHTGDVEETETTGEVKPVWKWDVIEGEFHEVMYCELKNWCEEIKEKPSCYASILLLIEIANYVSQWLPQCVQLARHCVGVIKSWIRGTDEQILVADPKDVPALRAKKGLFYHQALLCYAEGPLTRDDASSMCQILVHAENNSKLQNETPYDEQLKILINMRHNLMAKRINDLRSRIIESRYQILSDAMKVVLYAAPSQLHWIVMNYDDSNGISSCYQAEDMERNLYNINILNGVVLYNGAPISSLPFSVLKHPLYKRSFEDRNFETCVSKQIVKTVMPVKGCLYSFATQGEELIVIEKDKTTNIELILLDSLALAKKTKSWGADLPIILKDKYSHWYCEKKKVILFRHRYFCKRDVEFIMTQISDKEWKCFKIPSHLKGEIWSQYLEGMIDLENTFDRLVLNTPPSLDTLNKFEKKIYIHTLVSPTGDFKIHFPRFDLEFFTSSGSEGRLKSRDYVGYSLSLNQQLRDTLPHFRRYLVLEHGEHGSYDEKIVVPDGKVIVTDKGETTVETTDESSKKLEVFTYQIHNRFKNLQASSICARLHLAKLYASTGSLLPDQRMHMTGGEVAMQLVRQCWTNTPLTDMEHNKLNALSNKCHGVPALSLLCYELACSSTQLAFLYPTNEERSIKFPGDFAAEYLQEPYPWNLRCSLSADEELRVLGYTRQAQYRNIPETDGSECGSQDKTTHLTDHAAINGEDCLAKYDDLLKDFLKETCKQQEAFPLQTSGCDDPVEKSSQNLYTFMMKELEKSYKEFNELPKMELKSGMSELNLLLQYFLKDVTEKRNHLEVLLFKQLAYVSTNDQPNALSHRILQIAQILPKITHDDLLRSAINKEWIEQLNPFISHESRKQISRQILTWLKMCTLEDKMKRLLQLCKETREHSRKANELQIMQELGVFRSWSVEDHPQWLVFEVFAQLQIRPVQYTIAKSMIDAIEIEACNPVTQLNMGEGKTRVIIPMLVLYWRNTDKLVRLNFLSPLLREAWEYLHRVLSASVLAVKVLQVPFSRDVQLTESNVRTLVTSLNYCRESQGVVIVAPEHRLSLKLKTIEFSKKKRGREIKTVLDELDSFNFLDILDEVDELLRTKNKLIFALGNQQYLSSKESRWNTVQALLHVLLTNDKMRSILEAPLVSHRDQQGNQLLEIRLLPGEAFDGVKKNFIKTLIHELAADPPFELRWLKQVENNLPIIVKFITVADEIDLSHLPALDQRQMDDILALRGLLANNVFVHCLMKRNRVDYGVNRASGTKKMAVPFHACETPSPRAEFGHPDSALLYTCLAYYYDGLTQKQVCEAFLALLLMGENAQKKIYMTWYDASKGAMTDNHSSVLDSILKIDLTNTILVSHLNEYFSRNRFTINFWLNSCVFPSETMQFPQRLEATAWDLASNSKGKIAGFSGTNDDRLIMPTTLQWIEQKDSSLLATDGKMLHLLQKSTFKSLNVEFMRKLADSTDKTRPQWTIVLDFVIREAGKDSSHSTCALIDAGALMAGAPSNKEVAEYLAKHLLKGIIFYDISKNGWWVRDKFGREWPKHSSPIRECDGFVYFDEARTRGADMKLHSNARAVLTLGPDMCKDKLMQAAGRMRMLEHGQQLLIVAAEDVTSKIRHCSNIESSIPITCQHVLEWVMHNTITNITKWFSEWAFQGVEYFGKQMLPEMAFVPDTNSLEKMYGCCLEEKPVVSVVKEKTTTLLTDLIKKSFSNSNSSNSMSTYCRLNDIERRTQQYGQHLVAKMDGNVDQEYQRELEKEVELEKVEEKMIANQNARVEKLWDIQQFVADKGAQSSPSSNCSLINLGKTIAQQLSIKCGNLSHDFSKIKWPRSIFCTRNFFFACETRKSVSDSVNDYLRHIDSFLFCWDFANGKEQVTVILLSEMECDKLLESAWRKPAFEGCVLLNWAYTRQRSKLGKVTFQFPPTAEIHKNISDEQLAALSLFEGEVMFHTDGVKLSMEKLLSSYSAKQVAPLFSSMRGMGFCYSRSDLELICTTPSNTIHEREDEDHDDSGFHDYQYEAVTDSGSSSEGDS